MLSYLITVMFPRVERPINTRGGQRMGIKQEHRLCSTVFKAQLQSDVSPVTLYVFGSYFAAAGVVLASLST